MRSQRHIEDNDDDIGDGINIDVTMDGHVRYLESLAHAVDETQTSNKVVAREGGYKYKGAALVEHLMVASMLQNRGKLRECLRRAALSFVSGPMRDDMLKLLSETPAGSISKKSIAPSPSTLARSAFLLDMAFCIGMRIVFERDLFCWFFADSSPQAKQD